MSSIDPIAWAGLNLNCFSPNIDSNTCWLLRESLSSQIPKISLL